MRIATKLRLSVWALIAFLAISTTVSYRQIRQTNDDAGRLAVGDIPLERAVLRLQIDAERIARAVMEYMWNPGSRDRAHSLGFEDRLDRTMADVRWFAETDEEKALVGEVVTLYRQFARLGREIMDLADRQSVDRTHVLVAEFESTAERMSAIVEEQILPLISGHILTARERAERSGAIALATILAMGMLGILVVGGTSRFVARRMIVSLHGLTEGVERLHSGAVGHRVPVEAQDELGELATAFNEMTAQRERVQKELLDNESKFRALAETVAAGTFIFQGRSLLYVNPEAVNISGYSQQELLMMDFWDVVHPDHRDTVRKRGLARQAGEQVPARYEVKLLTKGGEERWVEFSANTIDFGGRVAILGTTLDITDRKLAEAALQKAHNELEVRVHQRTSELATTNERLRAEITARKGAEHAVRRAHADLNHVFDAALPLCVKDKDYNVVRVNDTFCSFFGVKRDEIVGRKCHDVVLGPSCGTPECPLAQAIRGSERTEREIERELGDGRAVVCVVTTTARRTADGELIGIVQSFTDITERKRAEEALRLKDKQLRDIEDSLPAGAVYQLIHAPDGRRYFEHVSAGFERIFSLTKETVAKDATALYAMIHPDDIDGGLRAEQHAAKSMTPFSYECRVVLPDGEIRWIHWDSMPQRLPHEGLAWNGVVMDVTERKRAEEALREVASDLAVKSSLLQAVFDATPDLVFAKDPELRTMLCNKAFADAVGKSPEELVGHTDIENGWDPVLVSGDPAQGIRGFESDDLDALAGRTIHNPRDPANVGDEIRMFDTLKLPLRDAQGQIFGILGMSRDITDRERAEEALRESEERFQAIADYTYGWENWIGPDGKLRWINSAAERIIGYSAEECLSRPDFPTCFVHEDDREMVASRFRGAVADKTSGEDFISRWRHRDGRIVWTAVSWQQIYSREGVHLGHRSSIRDITKRKRAEQALQKIHEELEIRVTERTSELSAANQHLKTEIAERTRAETALRKSEARQSLILRTLPMAFYVADVSSGFGATWVSEQIDRISGFAPRRWLEDSGFWASRLHPEDRERALREYEAVLVDDKVATEYRWRCADGTYRWFLDQAALVRDEQGRPKEAMGTWLDITDRKRTEEAARESEERIHELRVELAHVGRLSTMGEMASGLAHELNQPLAVITNYAQGILRRIESGSAMLEDLVDPVYTMARQATHAGQIIRRIKGFLSRKEPHRSSVNINEMIEEAIELLGFELRTRNVSVQLDRTSPLPPVIADRVQLHQVMLNLVLNAVNALNENDTPDSRIHISATLTDGGEVEITVRDNGPGVAATIREQIFEPFFTTREHGMGMGLAVCRSIVADHDGRLWMTPNPDRGATFHFSLPTSGASAGD